METEQKLIKLLFDKPNSKDILLLATKLEGNSNFILSKDIEKLQNEVAKKLGYKLVDHKLELYGSKIKK